MQGMGAVVMGIGLYSHFSSAWTDIIAESPVVKVHLYDLWKAISEMPSDYPSHLSCPAIAMERYFISVIIICFVASLVNVALGHFMDLKANNAKYADAGYHMLAFVMLIIGAILYLLSTKQIHDIFTYGGVSESELKEVGLDLKTVEKYTAGVT